MKREALRLVLLGERAAFHGAPGDGIAVLKQALLRAERDNDANNLRRAGWLLGVCYSSAGQYGHALRTLEPLTADLESTIGRRYGVFAATTIASVYRQLSLHERAQQFDSWALDHASKYSVARFDAWIGLAADSVGLGHRVAAMSAWKRASGRASVKQWRQQVRVDWVAAEIALLESRPRDALVYAQHAVATSRDAGAPRHAAKSLLFAGVAGLSADSHSHRAALLTLREAGDLADSVGALPLVWPIRSVIASVIADTDPASERREFARAADAAAAILSDLPPALAKLWILRPEISALIGSSHPKE